MPALATTELACGGQPDPFAHADLVAREIGLAIEDADRRASLNRLESALEQAFAQIAPQDRVLIALRFDQDMSIVEIAKLTASSVPTLHRRLDKSMKQLRSALSRAGFDPREVATLIGHPSTKAVRIDREDRLVVETQDVRDFYIALPQLAQEANVRLLDVSAADESLASVFSYLVEG
jgi:hypothetical protein